MTTTAGTYASWMLSQETRALLDRLERVKPFVLQETMVPAAALSLAAQAAVEGYLLRGRRALRDDVRAYLAWLEGEVHRGDATTITQAGRALSRFDARSWAGRIDVPAGALITTRDRLVPRRKQRRLAAALGARTVELAADHGAPWEQPRQFASLTVELVDDVIARSADSEVVSNAT